MTVVWEWDLPPTEKLVLLVIADHADDSGANAYPGIARIARRASLSERQVQRILTNLMRQGILHIDRQRGGGVDMRSDRRPNRYTIIGVTPVSPRVGDGVTLEDQRGDIGGIYGVTPMSPNPSIEPSNNKPSLADLRSSFGEFWTAYPRKVGKRDAESVFVRLMRSSDAPTLQVVLDAVARLKAENREIQFVPHPATWLRQGRWEDEVAVQEPGTVEERVQRPYCGECSFGFRTGVKANGSEFAYRCDCQL